MIDFNIHYPPKNEPPSSLPIPGQIVLGIRQAVKRLQEHDIETRESCEDDAGHAYSEPTVAFYEASEVRWRARGDLFHLWTSSPFPAACLGRTRWK